MSKAIKWILIAGGALFVLVIAALFVIPMFVDVQKFKPEIEKRVSDATGRSFSIGGELSLSLFPWAGLSFSGLQLGNPPGFKEKDFLSVKSFDVRVKLLPLISRDIQVKRFIIEEPRMVLEKGKDGRGNWEGFGKPRKDKAEPSEGKPAEGLPIKALAVGEFAITNGSVLWIDHIKGEQKKISDLTLRLKDVSLDRPIQLTLSADLDGKPISLEGNLGPVGKDPGKGDLPLNLSVKALNQLDMSLKGKIIDPTTRQAFDLDLTISPFSPRKLIEAMGQTFPVSTADPEALKQVALKAKLKGNPNDIAISDGTLDLDQSKLKFSVRAKEFSKPDIAFELNLDKINLDHYMPPPSDKKPEKEKKETKAAPPEEKKTDYTSLRKLILEGTVRVGELKAKGIRVQDILLKVVGKDGVFRLDPLSLKLYKGGLSSHGTFDVRQDVPVSKVTLQANGIQVGPFIQDFLKKDFLEGTVKADVAISMEGDDPDVIKRTLNGKGDLLFKEGAIVGIDLAGMVRNVMATFGLAEKGGEKPRTDFSEFHAPFTITNGEVNSPNTRLISPMLRVLAAGKAHLVNESLDFRVEPKFVTTLKGQGDMNERAGITVPVLVTGSFTSPKFRPDLKGMLKKTIEKGIPDPSKLKDILKEGLEEGGEAKPIEEKVKGLLKSLPLRR